MLHLFLARRPALLEIGLGLALTASLGVWLVSLSQPVLAADPVPQALPLAQTVEVAQPVDLTWRLKAGQTLETSVHVERPSQLPTNGRLRASWQLLEADEPQLVPRAPEMAEPAGRKLDAFEIATAPTANWSKLLHALDADVYLVYRAPVGGLYRLRIAPEIEAVAMFAEPRWREPGNAPKTIVAPSAVPWPTDAVARVTVKVREIDLSGPADLNMFVETEPNDTPEQAQPLPALTGDDAILHVTATCDDVEYFDNGAVGRGGDDWYRLEYRGTEPRLLTACLAIPDQQVAARVRCYRVENAQSAAAAGKLLPITETEEGKNPNERVHQQNEQHRIAINRQLQPGFVYFLRVEANAPGYELEVRVVRPAPYEDPRQAVRHGLYDHIGQVDSWLENRPRGASVERRIRDTGNLLGTNCMSCHTQSGVWGPAIPFTQGYRPQNIQLWRDLVNISYQSLRPTNKLIEAANNTSLAPLDLGDGPAGTRVTGHAIVSAERYLPPRKLQALQVVRVANFVLQSGDPGGVNAAGPGANVGQGVVFNYTGEILWAAWKATGNPHYFHALVEKATKQLAVDPKFTDDLCHRVEFFQRFFPQDYPAATERVLAEEQAHPEREYAVKFTGKRLTVAEAADLWQKMQAQIKQDIARLRQIQNADGSWHFNPGTSADGGQTWTAGTQEKDPAPTALGLIALQAAGFGPDDPAVAKGVAALLKMQHPTGYWNAASQTGFVTTSYSLHALSRLFPVDPPQYKAEQFQPQPNETLRATLQRVRALSHTEDPAFVPLMLDAARHDSPLVRFWGMIALGSVHTDAGVPALIAGLSDTTKTVREAAHWGLRQTLIDDRGWDQVFSVLAGGDDYAREAAMRTLVMKVDGVLPKSQVGWERLTAALTQGLNADAHPAVRAWAAKAAWQWWIWNPPVRTALNDAWIAMLSREETNWLVENCQRYQTQALFIANGHKANGHGDHQYLELGKLFLKLDTLLQNAREDDKVLEERLSRRLVAVAGTFFQQSGGDGGPGQMGYSTPGSGELFGEALLTYFKQFEGAKESDLNLTALKIGLEGAANVPHQELQAKLIDYSLHGPEDIRGLAASSVSDPKSVQLVAVPELIDPLLQQIKRGAAEPSRREQLSDPLFKLFGGVRWVIPATLEQQREVLHYLVPKFDTYYAQAAVDEAPDAAEKQRRAKQKEADWYLAVGLGDALGSNPDLHFDTTFEFFPPKFDNPLQSRYWLPSVNWILTYKTMLPEVKVAEGQLPPVDPFEEPRSRALRLFLSQLEESADPRSRELAVKLAGDTALRRNPEVLNALDKLKGFEKREHVVQTARNILSTGRDNFLKELAVAAKAEKPSKFKLGADEKPELTTPFIDDFTFFRDYVMPEMNVVLRGDQRSCMACHGVPGRVPPLTLHRPDDAGYLPVDKLLANYRLLQERVDLKEVDKSKLLRKPLNIQTGQEDGHQGGRRYSPEDPGYLILRKWALNQVEMRKEQQAAGF